MLDIFGGHNIARKKLKNELQLFMQGERCVEKYREAGIHWWDYCGSILMNSYPTYFEKLPPRSSDANLGLPADIYHLYLMARQIDLPLKSICLNIGNVHIYENNLEKTRNLIADDEDVKFELNV